MNPLVSVIMPTYNHAAFVGEAIRSLAAQTYTALELIVIDDGSGDQTFEQVLALRADLDNRFLRTELHKQQHEGTAATISRCLELSRSNVVFMLDSDDIALPHAIERLLPLFADDAVALAVGDNEYIDEAGHATTIEVDGEQYSSLLAFHVRDRANFSLGRDFGTYDSLIGGNYVPNGWLMRKDCIARVGGYRTDMALDDWPLLIQLSKLFRIAYAGETLAYYRLHPANSIRWMRDLMYRDLARTLLQEREYCVSRGLDAAWRAHAARIFPAISLKQWEEPDYIRALIPGLDDERMAMTRSLALALCATREPDSFAHPSVRSEAPKSFSFSPPVDSCAQRIHLYALCWNDVRVLPFFFRHYDRWVQRYVIYDDGSDDGSLDVLRSHPRVEVRRFVRTHPDSFVVSELEHYDHCWKESRGHADWVVVVDIDEHVFHPTMGAYLARCVRSGVTVVPSPGYEMISPAFPSPDDLLCTTVTMGVPAATMGKLSIFAPGAIEEISYTPGRHEARPRGRVLAPPVDEVRLLHYKLLGVDYVAKRNDQLRQRLPERDASRGWGHQWFESGEPLARSFTDHLRAATEITRLEATTTDSNAWWHTFSRAGLNAFRPEEIEGELERSVSEVARLRLLLTETEASIQRLSAECFRMSAERERLFTEGKWLSAERAGFAEQIQQKTARIAELEASRSWRWMSPARRIIDALRRIRGAQLP